MPESTPTRQLSARHDADMHLLRRDLAPSIRNGTNFRDLPGGPVPHESLEEHRARMGFRVQFPIDGLRTSLYFVCLPQQNTRLGLELDRSRLPALRHREGFPLFNNYLNATMAALENLLVITGGALGASTASGIAADAASPDTVLGSGGGAGHDAVLGPGEGGTHIVFGVVGTMPGDVPQAAVQFARIPSYRARSYNAQALVGFLPY
ncbi:hypothetical protein B0H16DRAFT_1448455 [Mycena metata]|uniref:Uncharacterized protein n=1 Tax=Mycena metata TaxID=1033252 RepID=A0AAD7NXE8_9AGAR|nr:hypothetical protein B0H16DRAFT_1448455 [Mycena metata]